MERKVNSSIRKEKGIGILNHEAILNEEQIIRICELLIENKYSLRQIGEMFNVSKSTISNIKRKQNWKHLTKCYDFKIAS